MKFRRSEKVSDPSSPAAKTSNEEATQTIPIAYEIFRYLSTDLKLSTFTKSGHIPLTITLKDKRLFLDSKDQKNSLSTIAGTNRFQNETYAKIRLRRSLDIAVSPIHFSNEVNFDSLYETLVRDHTAMIQKIMEEEPYAKFKRAMELFAAFIENGKAYEIDTLITGNIETKQICTWKASKAMRQQKELTLAMVDKVKVLDLPHSIKMEAVADMAYDLCHVEVEPRMHKVCELIIAKRKG